VFHLRLKLYISQDSWCSSQNSNYLPWALLLELIAWCEWTERKSDRSYNCFRAQQTNKLCNIKCPVSSFCLIKQSNMQDNSLCTSRFLFFSLDTKLVLQTVITDRPTWDHWQQLTVQHSPVSEDNSCWQLWHHRSHSHYKESHFLVRSWSLQIPVFCCKTHSVGCVIPSISKEHREPLTQWHSALL
jgi:hypothetical protein